MMKNLALGLALLSLAPVHASVVMTGTRIVYPANESEVTVKLFNDGKQPALVQTWIDQGDPKATPTTAKAPFTITPPIARLDPGHGQTLRISYTGEPLPSDRESVFYFNMLEVPPMPKEQAGASNNWLQMAIRSRMKLFFRPASLKQSVRDALPQLSVQLVHKDGKPELVVRNPSAYYVTLSKVELRGAGQAVFADLDSVVDPMLAPGGQQNLPLQGEPPAATQVHLSAISELGAVLEADRPLSR